ncbi:restriction endonuclease subunit S [Alistipes finegoldii]|nr:restriction endonuclease subunit S [Alistipes finegoldii]
MIYRGEDNSYYEKFLATREVKCIDEEIPFEIPATWEWCRLLSIVSLLGDGIHGTPEYSEGGSVYFINGNNLFDGQILIKPDTKTVSKEEAVKHSRLLNESTVLVSINGTIGNIAFYSGENVILGKSACYFNLLNGIERKYIKIVLQTDYFLEYTKRVATGSTIKNVPLSGMRNVLIPIPPKDEQQVIIDKLSSLKLLIEKFNIEQSQLNKLNAELRSVLKKSILQEAIQGKLLPQITEEGTAQELLEQIRQEKQRLVKEGKLKKSALLDSIIYKGDDNKYYEQVGKKCLDITEQIPFETPKNWVWTRLSHIANIYTGNSISETEKKSKFTDVIGRYYIGTKDVDFNNRIIYDNGIAIPKQYEPDFKLAPNNSILMCIEGGSAGRKIAILNQDVCFGNKLCCFSPFVGIGKYMYYYLQSPSFFELFNLNKTGIIGGVSIAKVKEILIPLPPIKEQQRIVAQIEKLFEQLR